MVAAPLSNHLTDGTAAFIIQSGHSINGTLSGTITVDSLHVQNLGLLEIEDETFTVAKPVVLDGDFSDASSGGSNTFGGGITVNSSGSFSITSTSAVTFEGDITVDGLFSTGSSFVTFQTNASTFVLNQDVTIAGGASILSDLTVDNTGGGSLVFTTNDVTVTSPATLINVNELEISSDLLGDGTFENQANAAFVYRGGSEILPSGSVDASASGNTIQYWSDLDQDIKGIPYQNVSFDHSGATSTKNLLGDILVNGDLEIKSSGVTLNASINHINILGNWDNNGDFSATSAIVTFMGSNNSIISGTGTNSFANLTLSKNSSTIEVQVNSDIKISSLLTLTTGVLVPNVTNGNVITFGINASSPTGSNSSFIRMDGVNSNTESVVKEFDNATPDAVAFTFPIGTGTLYTPLTLDIDNFSGLTSPQVAVKVRTDVASLSLPNASLALSKYWELTSTDMSSIEGTMQLDYDDTEVNGTEANYEPHYNLGSWLPDAAGSVNTATNTASFEFFNGTPTSSLTGVYSVGENEAFADANVAISTNGPVAGPAFIDSANHVMYQLQLDVSGNNTQLTDVSLSTTGDYIGGTDINQFTLYYTTSSTFNTSTSLGTLSSSASGSGETLNFTGLTQTITDGTSAYLWLVADIETDAVRGRTIQVSAPLLSDINFTLAIKSGTPIDGGVQTVAREGLPLTERGVKFYKDDEGSVDITGSNLPIGDANRTIAFWTKYTDTDSKQFFSYSRNTDLATGDKIEIGTIDGTTVQIDITSVTRNYDPLAEIGVSLNDGNWHHIAWVYENVGSFDASKLYVDGIEVPTTDNAGVGALNTQNEFAAIATSTSNVFGEMQLDEVKVLSTALTADEVLEIAYSLDASRASLVAYWDFEDGTGTGATDIAGGDDGTLSTNQSQLPYWAIRTINTDDAGTGSLRQAIIDANGLTGTHYLDFSISGTGPFTISPTTALDDITESVILDGYSQAGASENTIANVEGNDATLMITLDGSSAGSSDDGLFLDADNSIIRGLNIANFSDSGERGLFVNGDQNLIQGNFIGTDILGTSGAGNATGIYVIGNNNVIGDTLAAGANLIAANSGAGIDINGANTNDVYGNLIGVDATGVTGLGNQIGVLVQNSTVNNIGNVFSGASNVISSNGFMGILLTNNADNNYIIGNAIGTDISATVPLPNTSAGIYIEQNSVNDTIVFNVIAHNGTSGVGSGIYVDGNTTVNNHVFYANSIFSNEGEGIEFVGGSAQNNITAPNITAIKSDTTVHGTADPNAYIQLYADAGSQGQYLIDTVTADASGNWVIQLDATDISVIPVGLDSLTALQTLSGNTSEFSSPVIFDFADVIVATDGAITTSVYAGQPKVVLYQFSLEGNAGNTLVAAFDSVAFNLSGNVSDFSNFRFLYSATNDTSSFVSLGTLNQTGGLLEFSSVGNIVAPGATNYYFLVADVSASATTGNTISVDATPFTNFLLSSGLLSPDGSSVTVDTIPAGGTLTIADPIFYSQGDANFDDTNNWDVNPSGGGGAPYSTQFTDASASFIVQNGHIISGASQAINIVDITVENGGTLEMGANDFVTNGTTTIDGEFKDDVAGGENRFVGDITVSATGQFTGSTSTTAIEGNIFNTGTVDFTTSASVRFEGSSPQDIQSSATFTIGTIDSVASDLNVRDLGTIVTLSSVGGHLHGMNAPIFNFLGNSNSTNKLVVGGETIDGTVSGGLINEIGANLEIAATSLGSNIFLDVDDNLNTVTFNRTSGTQGIRSATDFYNLTLTGQGSTVSKSLADNIFVKGVFTLESNTTFDTDVNTFTADSIAEISGTFTDLNIVGSNNFNTIVNVNSTGQFGDMNSPITFADSVNLSGSYSNSISITNTFNGVLNVLSAGSYTAQGRTDLNNDLVNNGIFNPTSGGVFLAGNVYPFALTQFNDLEFIATDTLFDEGGNIEVHGNATINISSGRVVNLIGNGGATANSLIFNGNVSTTSGSFWNGDENISTDTAVVEFNGTAPSDVNFTNINNLVIYNSSSFQSMIAVDYYHVDVKGSDVQLTGNGRVNGVFNIDASGQFSMAGSTDTLTVTGSWTNSGIFNAGSNMVNIEFDKPSINNITHTGSGNFFDLRINTAVSQANLLNDITVDNDLILINGLIDLGSSDLTMAASSGIILPTGGSATTMVNIEGAGRMIRLPVSGSETFQLPIGSAGTYAPVTFTISSYTSGSTPSYTVIPVDGNASLGLTDPSRVLDRYWEVVTTDMTNIDGSISFEYTDAEVLGTEANYKVAHDLGATGTWTEDEAELIDISSNTFTYDFFNGTPIASLSGYYTVGELAGLGINQPPVSANNTITLTEDVLYTFDSSEFPFTDADGDGFGAVEIIDLPTVGSLDSAGVPVVAGQIIQISSISDLTFISAQDSNGIPYTDFTFRVIDDQDVQSDFVDTLTIDMNAVNDTAVASTVFISGITAYNESLTGNYTFTDVEGDSDNSTFQWYRDLDGSLGTGDEVLISGATLPSYTITGDDIGYYLIFRITPNDGFVDGDSVEAITATPVADPLIVTDASDSGPGTLRNALDFANNNGVADEITFDVASMGTNIIELSTDSLSITEDSTFINGDSNSDCIPEIIIRPATTTFANTAIGVYSDIDTIRGLVIQGFSSYGIRLDGASSNVIECNFIGTDATGLVADGNQIGVGVRNSSIANLIQNNVISANTLRGIEISDAGSNDNQVLSNYIGLGADGATDLGNDEGVLISDFASNNNIGNGTTGNANIISGNNNEAIRIADDAFANGVFSNVIGLAANGTDTISNLRGIVIQDASFNLIGGVEGDSANLIGGNEELGIALRVVSGTTQGNVISGNFIGFDINGDPAENRGFGIGVQDGVSNNFILKNAIANNADEGVIVDGSSTSGITIVSNAIFSNGAEGISLTNGANGGILPPTITDIGYNSANAEYTITGTGAADENLIILHADLADEGQKPLDTAWVVSGEWSVTIHEDSLTGFNFFTANQTDTATKNSSEFSTAHEIGFATLVADQTIVCDSVPITFTANFSNTLDGTVTYDFLIDGVSALTTASNIFVVDSLDNGDVVTVNIIEDGVVKYISEGVTITEHPLPDVAFAFSNACEDSTVTFTSSSTVASGSIVLYEWDFDNDGVFDVSGSTESTVNHVYSTFGSYSVKLRLTTDNGCQDSLTQVIDIHPNPVADFTFSNVCEDSTVTFNSTSTVATGSIVLYEWDFDNDGIFDVSGSTETTPSHVYAVSGSYTVVLRVTSDSGCVDTVSNTIEIHPNPDASFTFSDVCEDSTVTFNSTSTVASGSIVLYEWDFDNDGTFDVSGSTETTPSHVYTAFGTYTVLLQVTSNNGCVDTVTNIIEIYPNPEASFTFSDVCEDSTVTFNSTATITSGSIVLYEWDFDNDGTFEVSGSTETTPNHVYTAFGTYTVLLRVTSDNGCTDTVTNVIEIFPNPIPTLVVDNSILCDGFPATFTAGGGDTYRFRVNEVEVQSGLINTFITTTLKDGDIVDVIVSNSNGCNDTSSTIPITVNPIPEVSILDLASSYSIDEASVIINSTTDGSVGGVRQFFGKGITDNSDGTAIYDPAQAGLGIDTVVYAFTNGSSACVGYDTVFVTINDRGISAIDLAALIAIHNTANADGGSIPWNANDAASQDTAYNWMGVTVVDSMVTELDLTNFDISDLNTSAIASLSMLDTLDISNNRLLFGQIVEVVQGFAGSSLVYAPQQNIDNDSVYSRLVGADVTFEVSSTGVNDVIEWSKDGVPIANSNSTTLTLTNLTVDDIGVYIATITNPDAPDLTLTRNQIELSVVPELAPNDAEILDMLFTSLGGSGWLDNTNWGDPSVGHENWTGIELIVDPNDPNVTRVISIDLSNNNLSGEIPEEIFNLPELQRLDLFNNSITGEIPSTIENAVNLEYLDLDNNDMSGPVPEEIGALTNLRTLWLARNDFTSLPSTFVNLSSLENLFAQDNDFSSLPDGMNNLTNLRIINFNNNNLENVDEIDLLTNLVEIRLANNNLTSFATTGINNLSNLTLIDLDNNELTTLPTINSTIHPNLVEVRIRNNRLDFEEIDAVYAENSNNYVTRYSPQKRMTPDIEVFVSQGGAVFVRTGVDPASGQPNTYQWYKDDILISNTLDFYAINSMSSSDSGTYYAIVENAAVPDLQITSYYTSVRLTCGIDFNVSIKTDFATEFCDNVDYRAVLQVDQISKTPASYQWRRDGVGILGAADSTLTAFTAGEYSLVVTDDDGCSTVSDTITIVSNPAPDVEIVQVDELTLKANDRAGGSVGTYQWYLNGSAIAGATDSVYSIETAGDYQVSFTNEFGCTDFSTQDVITGVEDDLLAQSTVIFPNPNKGNFTIQFALEIPGEIKYRITNSVGKLVKEHTSRGETSVSFDLSEVASGIYYIEIVTDKAKAVKRVSKQ